MLPKEIFRAYDIRGVVDTHLTADVVYQLGQAIGSEALDAKQTSICVARDGRLSGPELSEALINGLLTTGIDVIDIGRVPTAVLYFATHMTKTQSGVVLTGSHNPSEYNGLKMVIAGKTLAQDKIQTLYQRILAKDLHQGQGCLTQEDITSKYLERITSDVHLPKKLKIVIDSGNGIAGEIAPQLFRLLGCDVIELYCEIDGNFPNHHPDPSDPKNCVDLQNKVIEEKADFGLAFDGDADRLGVISNTGEIIWPDRQMILFSQAVLKDDPQSTIVYDVKCTKHLGDAIQQAGGKPIMAKTGHSLIKAKMLETNAALAGEMSGHIFFKHRWYGFDDGIYAAARFCEIIAGQNQTVTELFETIPDSINTPEIKIHIGDEKKFLLMQQLCEKAEFPGAELIRIDGLRVEYPDGWGLVRASNTTPCLVMRFEAESEAALGRIQEAMRVQLKLLDPSLELSDF